MKYSNYLKRVDSIEEDADESKMYHASVHHFEELMKHVAWEDIMIQLSERLRDIRNDLENPTASPDNISVAILRQEAHDIRWFMALPEMTIAALKQQEEKKDENPDTASA